jgi:hypothetical protein
MLKYKVLPKNGRYCKATQEHLPIEKQFSSRHRHNPRKRHFQLRHFYIQGDTQRAQR